VVLHRASYLSCEFEYDESDPDGFRAGVVRVGRLAGGRALAVKAFEVPPGQSICPYHYEYEEEWLVVLEGSVLVRTPDGQERVSRGEVVCFPQGPEGAHRVGCDGEERAVVMMFPSAREPAVAVYPDSDKIGVWPGNKADDALLYRRDGSVGYYDGEV
jgi:uncharacterized cupin superfamily protein